VVPYARAAAGVNVAVNPLNETAPATAVPPGPVTVKDVALMDAEFIAMLKVAPMVVLTTTPVAPFAGTVDTTEGTVTVSSPQPATKTNMTTANQDAIHNLHLLI
jgi:hypothetical protein